MSPFVTEIKNLQKQLNRCLIKDHQRFRNRLIQLDKRFKRSSTEAEASIRQSLSQIATEISRSKATVDQRLAQTLTIEYPETLPVSAKRDEIATAIANHQVVIIAGETGSGKTTQIPKICLELGRGSRGVIAHTQPRRIAARSVAIRIASELLTPCGDIVGFKVRFHDKTSLQSRVKLMTDGILLAEIQSDPKLLQYDTIIIDEAHERSLNIDFLMGYLKQLLPKRNDLRIIITSATINTEKFSTFFHKAPIIEVSGRSFPVDILYHPLHGDEDSQDQDLPLAIVDAVETVGRIDARGDVLVFLPGEREIRETAEALHQHSLKHTEIVPLYSRLSPAEQDRVFQTHSGRRIVLSTNVAETSLTVPGIRFVIDSGLARISRYSPRMKIQRLPIEPIAQASANQRAGRCGRVSHGTCIRLYAESHFNNRPEQTDPEVLRTNLASVILQMASLGLGDVAKFPFMDAPDSRAIHDGYRLLMEIEAVNEDKQLTPLGKKLARMPLDPRMARMLIAAEQRLCLQEVLIIVSALSVQDPRMRPSEAQQAADEQHRKFAHEHSDFLAWLNLWQWYQEQNRHLSRAKMRKLCHDRFLSFVRMREWHDLHSQLLTISHELGMKASSVAASPDEIHQALLAGLLSHVAVQGDDRQFLGARGLKFALFPGSSLFKKPPKWIMAAELVETQRLYARTAAAIDPEWLERVGAHLIHRDYGEAYWSAKRAQVLAPERLSLFGIIIGNRRIHYGPIDAAVSRALFIRHALVLGEYRTHGKFFEHNKRLIAEVEMLEAKSRRRDLLADEEALFDFFDAIIPDGIVSGKMFEKWRKTAEQKHPKILFLTQAQLLKQALDHNHHDFPDMWEKEGLRLKFEYQFDPSHHADGVTLLVPLAALGQLMVNDFDWLVPGMLTEKVAALIKALPKGMRKHFVPVPQYAEAVVERLTFAQGHLLMGLSQQLKIITGVDVPLLQWQPDQLPNHLRINFRILAEKGRVLAESTDLPRLQQRFSKVLTQTIARDDLITAFEKSGLKQWGSDTALGDIPEHIEHRQGGLLLRRYPALVDEGESVALRLFETESLAMQHHRQGVLRLLMLQMHQQVAMLQKNMPGLKSMMLHYAAFGNAQDLCRDIIHTAFHAQFLQDGVPRTALVFEACLEAGRGGLMTMAQRIAQGVVTALEANHTLQRDIAMIKAEQLKPVIQSIQSQVQALIYPGFVAQTPSMMLQHFPRFIEAARLRLQKAGRNRHDAALQAEVDKFYQLYQQRSADLQQRGLMQDELMAFRWLIEELRVSLFAQELKTAQPVSVKRLQQHWELLRQRVV
ncbi:MAG: ATP-dependent RNA helicase HrpA [Zetaproteobacteria bacterium]|nr:ATP-dependent RNA helicase HrpA [Zetaproteobacteria bacterium]